MTAPTTSRKAFTLIELMAVIVVLAILAGVVVPAYYDFAIQSRVSACKGTLGGVRTGVIQFHATNAATYPTFAQLNTIGLVSHEEIPVNPYNQSKAVRNADGEWTSPPPAPPISGPEGWAYDQTTGKFWANTNVAGENVF